MLLSTSCTRLNIFWQTQKMSVGYGLKVWFTTFIALFLLQTSCVVAQSSHKTTLTTTEFSKTSPLTSSSSVNAFPFQFPHLVTNPSHGSAPSKGVLLEDAISTVTSINFVWVSYTTVVDVVTAPTSTTTFVVYVAQTISVSTTLITTQTITTTPTIVTTPVSTASGLCYGAAQDILTPCTTAVIAAATSSRPATSGASRNGIIVFGTFFKIFNAFSKPRPMVRREHLASKKDSKCFSWVLLTAIIFPTSTVIAGCIVIIGCKNRRKLDPYLHQFRFFSFLAAFLVSFGLLVWSFSFCAIYSLYNCFD
ncbi:hypothetical protein ACMFMG_007620 [Clarireedia jacksonii]